MSFTIYDACVPVLAPMLTNMAKWLELAESHAAAKGEDSRQYLALRLAPDMLPFTAQVKIAGDIAKMTVSRLTDIPMTAAPEADDSLQALRARALEAAEFVRSADPAKFAGAEDRAIALPQRQGDPLQFTGRTLLQQWALPNVFFHLTTTYDILRHAGVELGKADFLGTR